MLIAALFSVLGTSLAVTRKPSDIKLQWLNSGKGMKITFPDKTTDEIELQADPQNECFYHGPITLLEYQTNMRRCRFDALGKSTPAHRTHRDHRAHEQWVLLRGGQGSISPQV